jgi:hypothetical protein
MTGIRDIILRFYSSNGHEKVSSELRVDQLCVRTLRHSLPKIPTAMKASWVTMKKSSQKKAASVKPYEWRPMPSMLVPNQDQLVTMLPKMARTMRPRSRTMPPQRACRIIAFQITMSSAPFSFGSQPQNRPQDWSAQMPPRMVPWCRQS